jgi:protocatechuate 3,4-dioxygenase beta subunit
MKFTESVVNCRQIHLTRRKLPVGLSLLLAFSVVGLSCNPRAVAEKVEKKGEPGTTWKTVIVSEKEPGEPLVISGRVFAPDGQTPLEGITLFVYQTDATGVYSGTAANGDSRNTRIHGAMRTDADGRYEFRTIKPGSYPQSRNPAHIHAYVSGPGYPEYWIDEYLFDDDPFVTDDVKRRLGSKGSFSSVLKLTRGSDGVLRGVRDIKIERCTKNCTGR